MTGSSCWTIPRRTIGSSLNDDPLDHVRCWPVLHLPLARKNPGSRSNLLPTQSMLGIRVEHATAIPNQAMHWASPEKIENARDCLQHVCVCVQQRGCESLLRLSRVPRPEQSTQSYQLFLLCVHTAFAIVFYALCSKHTVRSSSTSAPPQPKHRSRKHRSNIISSPIWHTSLSQNCRF